MPPNPLGMPTMYDDYGSSFITGFQPAFGGADTFVQPGTTGLNAQQAAGNYAVATTPAQRLIAEPYANGRGIGYANTSFIGADGRITSQDEAAGRYDYNPYGTTAVPRPVLASESVYIPPRAEMRAAPAPAPVQQSPYGDLSGSAPPFGDLSGAPFSRNPGGDYNDMDNVPYDPTGGADLRAGNPFRSPTGGADLAAGNPFARSPYGDLSGVRSPYGDISGVPAMRAPNAYGDLSGATALRTGGASLSDNNPFDLANFQNRYTPPRTAARAEPTPPPRPYTLDTGGATLERGLPAIDTSFQNPSQAYRMPPLPIERAAGSLDFTPGMSDRDLRSFDQSYMDEPRGPYGSLYGAAINEGSTIDRADGRPIGNPYGDIFQAPVSNPIDTSFRNPPQPMMSGVREARADGGFTERSPVAQSASRYFAGNITPARQTAPTQTAYGSLNRTFQPMPGVADTSKITTRAPQTGGFTSYSAPRLPAPTMPTQSPAMERINQALTRPLGGSAPASRGRGILSGNIFRR